MSWQREDDGTLVYESDSLWRAVIFSAAGIFGAYIERPSERPIPSPVSFDSVAEARAWCQAILAEIDPPNAGEAYPATYTPGPSRCPLCNEAIPRGQLQQHLQIFHPKPKEKRVDPKRYRPVARKQAIKALPPPPVAAKSVSLNCPICNKLLKTPEGVKSHIAAKHGSAAGARASQHNSNVPTSGTKAGQVKSLAKASTQGALVAEKYQCPRCSFVARNSLEQAEHMRTAHRAELDRAIARHRPTTPKKRPESPNATQSSRSRPLAAPMVCKPTNGSGKRPCPICQKLVSSEGLNHHLQVKHGQRIVRAERYSRSESPGRGTNSRDELSLEALEQSYEDKRDASRGWGHLRRDYDGTWGSMPVHDDYSDESDAY